MPKTGKHRVGTINILKSHQFMKKFYITTLFLLALLLSKSVSAQIACHASFFLDTTASTSFNAVIVNNSTFFPALTPPDSGVYFWSWGDGTSSTGKYPTHTYTSAGQKYIYLDINNVNKTCGDSIAKMITIDTLGGFHKTNGSYTIKVVAPKIAGITVEQNNSAITLTSTLVRENAELNFKSIASTEKVNIEILSYDGRKVMSLNENITGNKLMINTTKLSQGMYFMTISVGQNTSLVKFIKE